MMPSRNSLWAKLFHKTSKRPVLDLPRTPLELALELCAAGGIAFLAVVLLQAWPHLPPRIPTHFGISGRPDAWGGTDTLLIFPAVAGGLYVMFTIINRFPHTFNYPWPITERNAETQYLLARTMLTAVKAEVVWLMAYLQWITVGVALGRTEGLGGGLVLVFLPVLAATTALYFLKAYQAR